MEWQLNRMVIYRSISINRPLSVGCIGINGIIYRYLSIDNYLVRLGYMTHIHADIHNYADTYVRNYTFVELGRERARRLFYRTDTGQGQLPLNSSLSMYFAFYKWSISHFSRKLEHMRCAGNYFQMHDYVVDDIDVGIDDCATIVYCAECKHRLL